LENEARLEAIIYKSNPIEKGLDLVEKL